MFLWLHSQSSTPRRDSISRPLDPVFSVAGGYGIGIETHFSTAPPSKKNPQIVCFFKQSYRST
jgi:hypothetical protein